MPTVRRREYNPVQQAGIQAPRASTTAPIEAFGGGSGVGEAIQRSGAQVDSLLTQEKQKADDLANQEAFARAVTKENERKAGAFLKKGKDAFGVIDEYGSLYKKDLDEIESGLSNDDQRAMFRRIRAQREASFNSALQKHVFQESQAYDKETTEAAVRASRNDAVLNYQDPGRVDQALRYQDSILMSHAQRNGMSPEQAKLLITENRSETHSSVINRLLANGQDQLAKQYYDRIKDEITAKHATGVDKALEEGSLRGESQRKLDQITRSAPTMTAALEEARKITDPKLRDETERRVRDYYSIKKAADAEAREQQYQRAALIAEQTKDRDRIPPDVWASLSLSERSAIDARIKQLRQGIQPETNWEDYYSLKSLASSAETRDGFLKTNLLVYRPKMADAEFKELVNLQTQLRKGDQKALQEIDGYRTTSQIVDGYMKEAGIEPNSTKKSEAEKANRFRNLVEKGIRDHFERTGKKPTRTEIKGIVSDLMTEVEVEGTLWDPDRRLFEVQPGEEVIFDDIPDTERSKIEAVLRARGLPVTEERVTELYQRKLRSRIDGN